MILHFFQPFSSKDVFFSVNSVLPQTFSNDSLNVNNTDFMYSSIIQVYRTQSFLLHDDILSRYFHIFLFVLVAFGLSFVLFGLSYILYQSTRRTDYFEKVSPYECGFNTFGDARETFDIRFYLVAILFLIFDLEIGYLFPWAITLDVIGVQGMLAMLYFLIILTIGYVYEWLKGALEWS